MKYKIMMHRQISLKVREGGIPPDLKISKFGRYWWFWMPVARRGAGRFRLGEYVVFSFKWLCFSVELIFWPDNLFCCPKMEA